MNISTKHIFGLLLCAGMVHTTYIESASMQVLLENPNVQYLYAITSGSYPTTFQSLKNRQTVSFDEKRAQHLYVKPSSGNQQAKSLTLDAQQVKSGNVIYIQASGVPQIVPERLAR